MRTTLAAKHAERLRAEIAAHGCPRPDPAFEWLWCSACVDRDQMAGELERLDGILAALVAERVVPDRFYGSDDEIAPHAYISERVFRCEICHRDFRDAVHRAAEELPRGGH